MAHAKGYGFEMRSVLLLLSDQTYDFCLADEMGKKKIPLTYIEKEGTFTYTV